MNLRKKLYELCVAIGLIAWVSTTAAAQSASSAALTSTAAEHTQRVEDTPSAFWLIAGITLGAGGLALGIDNARRLDDGDPSCFAALEPGGCLVEAFAAGPIGGLGGVSLVLYGLWLGEHDASLALAQGQPLEDHSALETWSWVSLATGYAVAVGINVYAVARLYSDYDEGACEDAGRAERADKCAGGKILGLSIVQSIGYAIALLAAEPFGYVQGYDNVRRKQRKSQATVLPWVERGSFGLAIGLQL